MKKITRKKVRWLFLADFHKAMTFQKIDQIINKENQGFSVKKEKRSIFVKSLFMLSIISKYLFNTK